MIGKTQEQKQLINKLYLQIDTADDICREMYDFWQDTFINGEEVKNEEFNHEYNLDDIKVSINNAIKLLNAAKQTIAALKKENITTAAQISKLYDSEE